MLTIRNAREDEAELLTEIGLRAWAQAMGAIGGSDALQEADGSLQALDGQGGYVAWRHAFNPKLRGNLFVSAASYDNNPLISGLAVTKSARSIHANLIYTVLPKLEIGAELIHGNREIESGLDGDLRRLHMHVKYSF